VRPLFQAFPEARTADVDFYLRGERKRVHG
jgi:hypothetical protein